MIRNLALISLLLLSHAFSQNLKQEYKSTKSINSESEIESNNTENYNTSGSSPGNNATPLSPGNNYLSTPNYEYYSNVLQHLQCGSTGAKFIFSINFFGAYDGRSYIYSVGNLTTGEYCTLGFGVDQTGSLFSITNLANGDPLTPGTYQIFIQTAGPNPITITQQVYIGFEVTWEPNVIDYVITPSTNSVKRLSPFNNNFSLAKAQNKSNSTKGWIAFTPKVSSSPNGLKQLIRFNYNDFSTPINNSNKPYIQFWRIARSSVKMEYFDGNNANTTLIDPDSRIRYEYDASSAKIFINNVLWQTFGPPGLGSIVGIQCQSKTEEDGFEYLITSFSCTLDAEVYAKVERKLKGVNYEAQDTLRFYLEEEYNNTGQLNYRIYNSYDRVNPIQIGANQPLPVEYGDNRYQLNVSTLITGTYLLEVENQKKEKFYLRFTK